MFYDQDHFKAGGARILEMLQVQHLQSLVPPGLFLVSIILALNHKVL